MALEPSSLNSWYGAGSGSPGELSINGGGIDQSAYHSILGKLNSNGKMKLASNQSIEDLHSTVQSCMDQYTGKRASSKARVWLSRFSSKINYYGNILDVLVQHHPEYVSLAWGAFKFLFVAVQNHESVIALLAKALSRIGDSLPRVEFYTVLYSTERIKVAVVELYAQLLEFFDRALTWCQEGKLLHFWHSLTKPPALQYGDILERMDELSRRIDQLAISGLQAETRAIHIKVDAGNKSSDRAACDILARMEAHEKAIYEVKTHMIAFQTLNSSSAFSTNQTLNDIQFSNILASISASALGDALESFRHHRTILKFQRRSEMDVVKQLGASPQLNKWASSTDSGLVLVRGSFNTRHALYKLFVGIGDQLHESEVPCIMALKPSPSQTGLRSGSAQVSAVDVLKHLTLQVLRTSTGAQTEKSVSLTCTQFQTETTAQGWLGLLEASIARISRPVYIVIDLDVLDVSATTHEHINWVKAVLRIMDHLRTRQSRAQVKVLLGGFGQGLASQLRGLDDRCPLVSIPTRKAKHAQPIGPKGGRGARVRFAKAGATVLEIDVEEQEKRPFPSASPVASFNSPDAVGISSGAALDTMGLTPSKPATSPPVSCHQGRFVLTSGYVYHALGPNAYLRVGFDRPIVSEYFHPNAGGKFSSRVIYTGNDGSDHEQQSRSNPP
ncbi:hypothetical protein PG984_010344 [Apiospora sp. TS-2023a]